MCAWSLVYNFLRQHSRQRSLLISWLILHKLCDEGNSRVKPRSRFSLLSVWSYILESGGTHKGRRAKEGKSFFDHDIRATYSSERACLTSSSWFHDLLLLNLLLKELHLILERSFLSFHNAGRLKWKWCLFFLLNYLHRRVRQCPTRPTYDTMSTNAGNLFSKCLRAEKIAKKTEPGTPGSTNCASGHKKLVVRGD